MSRIREEIGFWRKMLDGTDGACQVEMKRWLDKTEILLDALEKGSKHGCSEHCVAHIIYSEAIAKAEEV